jgi:hypothetical protein
VEKFDWDLAARKTLDYYRRSLEEFCSGMRER